MAGCINLPSFLLASWTKWTSTEGDDDEDDYTLRCDKVVAVKKAKGFLQTSEAVKKVLLSDDCVENILLFCPFDEFYELMMARPSLSARVRLKDVLASLGKQELYDFCCFVCCFEGYIRRD